jgi:hypothetical protein
MTTAEKVGSSEPTITPSGVEIIFEAEPKRRYLVRNNPDYDGPVTGRAEWIEAPSVTTVLKVLDKPALPWWGQGVGIEGTIKLFNLGLLKGTIIQEAGRAQQVLTVEGDMGEWVAAGKAQVEELLKKTKTTVNHVKQDAGDRGKSVHDALEAWATMGTLPDPRIYPPTEQGYVIGLLAFLEDAALTPLDTEVLVASCEHAYAGRYDLRARVTEERPVVKHRTPVRGAQYATLKPGLGLFDLKTSKDVYETHCVQLEAYELASIECGYEPTDFRGVIHVSADGNYKLVRSWAVPEDFLAVLNVYNAFEKMAERKKGTK